jgi:DNA-binding transcriptional regulator GbsR (MarR family)
MKEDAMPGGRLTQQDRQQIALGVADGLAYAEIARRLDRPTSTITREVMRNGGPTGYRADLAHRATERRAHQRRPAPSRGSESAPQPHGRDAEAVREYEEMFTTVLMQAGTPKMMARVMTCLYTTDAGSLTASELAQRLQVSPASVSKAIAFLESQDLVRRERDERRRERYVVDDDLWHQSTIASARSLVQLVEIARQGVDVLGRDTPAAVRLENIARYLDFVAERFTRAAEQAREILYTQPKETQKDGVGNRPAEFSDLGVGQSGRVEDPGEEGPGALVLRVGDDLGGWTLFDDHTVVHEDDPVGHVAGEAHLVGDDEHGHAVQG